MNIPPQFRTVYLGEVVRFVRRKKRSAARNRNRILRQGSLAQTHPDLAAEWNYELNGDLRPDDVTKGASRKVWWTCPKGHTYQSTIANRVSGRKCPVCAGKKIIDGVNDLATLNPSLAQEWDYERNQNLTPNQISPNSHKKVWWICKNGHEWEAQVKSRNYGCGCPMCAKGERNRSNSFRSVKSMPDKISLCDYPYDPVHEMKNESFRKAFEERAAAE